MSNLETTQPEDPSKRDVGEALKSVERAEDHFFADLERQMREFLREPGSSGSGFENTRLKVFEQEEKSRNDSGTHDVIKIWEEDNEDYQRRYVTDKMKVENSSDKDVSLEFLDYLVGNFIIQNTKPELAIKLEEIEKIRVCRVSSDGNGIIISLTIKDGKIAGLIFVGAPEFNLKVVEFNKNVYSF